jgi:hypothetical protein
MFKFDVIVVGGKGFGVLLDSGMPVHTTADDLYTIHELQCNLLKQKGINYIREK